jgi:hypothetical protein
VNRPVVYAARKDHPDFAAAWADAIDQAADALELEARRRAVDGVDEPVLYQGQPCGTWVNDHGEVVAKDTPGARLVPLTVKKYSDTLLMGLLRAHRPDKFRDTPQRQAAGPPAVNVHVTTKVTVLSREQFRALPLDEQVRLLRAPGRLQITD